MILKELRDQIDQIDHQILELLIKRAELALEVGKQKYKEKENTDFYRPEREQQILEKITHNNPGPLNEKALKNVFCAIMNECRQLQELDCEKNKK